MNILIVENDPLIVEDLIDKLETLGYPSVQTSDNVADALEATRKIKPDVVLIDIELNGEHDGIYLGEILQEEKIPFIYLSAMQNMNTFERAKKTNPQTNLPKPVSHLQLRNSLLEIAFEEKRNDSKSFIMISHGDKKHKINKAEIVYLKAARNNCEIFLSENERFVSSTPMNNVQKKLNPSDFIQVHRSHVINVNKVDYYEGNMIHLHGIKEPIPLSDTYRRDFVEHFDNV